VPPAGRFLKKAPQKLFGCRSPSTTPAGRDGGAAANYACRQRWVAGIVFKTCLLNFLKV